MRLDLEQSEKSSVKRRKNHGNVSHNESWITSHLQCATKRVPTQRFFCLELIITLHKIMVALVKSTSPSTENGYENCVFTASCAAECVQPNPQRVSTSDR